MYSTIYKDNSKNLQIDCRESNRREYWLFGRGNSWFEKQIDNNALWIKLIKNHNIYQDFFIIFYIYIYLYYKNNSFITAAHLKWCHMDINSLKLFRLSCFACVSFFPPFLHVSLFLSRIYKPTSRVIHRFTVEIITKA